MELLRRWLASGGCWYAGFLTGYELRRRRVYCDTLEPRRWPSCQPEGRWYGLTLSLHMTTLHISFSAEELCVCHVWLAGGGKEGELHTHPTSLHIPPPPPPPPSTLQALSKLHQLEVLGSPLVVEFAHSDRHSQLLQQATPQ